MNWRIFTLSVPTNFHNLLNKDKSREKRDIEQTAGIISNVHT